MGSACCVAARDKTLPNRTSSQYANRNIRYSPSWSFRWDNRTHIEDRLDNHAPFPCENSHQVGFEIKHGLEREIETPSDEGRGSPAENFRMPTWQNSPIHEETNGNFTGGGASGVFQSLALPTSIFTCGTDLSRRCNIPPKESHNTKLLAIASTSSSKHPMIPVPPSPNASSSVSKADPSSSQSCPLSSNHAPRRMALCSPRHQLSRQLSESQVPILKSPNNNSFSEGRQSFALPASRNDSTFGSHGGSSDGWSMHMFSELVASSQRERWSFDSENASSGHLKTSRSSSPQLTSPSSDLQVCGLCSKLLTERSAWSTQKIIASSELSVIAVLVCGHVYHAECLENTTTEKDRYDPSCPVCTVGEKPTLKMFSRKRAEADWKSRNKISRIGVTDVDIDGDALSDHRKSTRRESKGGPKMGASSSMKSSFARPFLRRHFSIGSKSSSRLPSEVDSRRKGFWARYRKE